MEDGARARAARARVRTRAREGSSRGGAERDAGRVENRRLGRSGATRTPIGGKDENGGDAGRRFEKAAAVDFARSAVVVAVAVMTWQIIAAARNVEWAA